MNGLFQSEGRGGRGFLIAIIAVLLVPLVYVAIILTASWGPYDNLSSLPVAVVNNDEGGMSGETPINVGKDLVENLKSNKTLGWDFVDSETAAKGIDDLKYYMVIEIPSDFSQKVTTVLDENPQKPELKYTQNEGLHFMAAQVTSNAAERIRSQLSTQVTETYTKTLFASLGDIAKGFKDGADGSSKLSAGATELHNGTTTMLNSLTEKATDIDKLAAGTMELENGTGTMLKSLQEKSGDISKLADGSKKLEAGSSELLKSLQDGSGKIGQLADGAKQVSAGAAELEKGSGQLLAGLQTAKSGSASLNGGLAQLAPGSKQVADGATAISDNSLLLAAGAAQIAAGLERMAQAQPQLMLSPDFVKLKEGSKSLAQNMQRLSAGAEDLKNGAGRVADGLAQAAPGAAKLDGGLKQLVDGQAKLNQGAKQLAAGSKTLAAGNDTVNSSWGKVTAAVSTINGGLSQVSDGNQAVKEGWGTLTAGTARLNDGMKQVSAGNQTVKTGWGTLTDGVKKVDGGVGQIEDGSKQLAAGLAGGAEKTSALNTADSNVKMFAAPVQTAAEVQHKFPMYRYANAPYILSLALFVGALVMSLLFDLNRPAVTAVTPIRWYAGKYGTMAGLAAAQGLLVSLIAAFLVKSGFTNGLYMIGLSVLASVTFMTIIFFLTVLAGNIGRFIAFAFLVLQLSTTGSALPIHMLPDNLQALSNFLPLTYSIGAYKAVITLDNYSSFWTNTGTLLIFLAIAAGLTAAVVMFRSNRRIEQADVAA
ncbi:YhgE/Pip family protein [Peribacillus sp. SCS-155]|uniref:YhgE/Pip family protein n=1 Tax=Peribacillus sedimenti TaxID=3115297 RepID=UPI003906BFBC